MREGKHAYTCAHTHTHTSWTSPELEDEARRAQGNSSITKRFIDRTDPSPGSFEAFLKNIQEGSDRCSCRLVRSSRNPALDSLEPVQDHWECLDMHVHAAETRRVLLPAYTTSARHQNPAKAQLHSKAPCVV